MYTNDMLWQSVDEPCDEQNSQEPRHRMVTDQLSRIEAPADHLREFFGAEASQNLATLTWEVDVADFLMAQHALRALLPEYRVVRECRYHGIHPALVKRRAVAVGADRVEFVIEDGREFWQGPGDHRLVLDLEWDDSVREPWSEIVFTLPAERYETIRTLIPHLQKWMNGHHFRRGKALDATGEFLRMEEIVAWEDVLLPQKVRDTIEFNCIALLQRADLYRAHHVPLKRGILLYGKPGTGKSMIGKALARACKATFILATPGMLDEPEDVRRIFKWARDYAPTILFFEDLDLVASSRNGGHGSRKMLGEFLVGLDGVDGCDGLITIATTNDLDAIEPALKDRPNRFDCVMEVPPLDEALRRKMLDGLVQKHRSLADVDRLVHKTGGYTGAQLQELWRLAVIEALGEVQGDACTDSIKLENRHFDCAFGKFPGRSKEPIGFKA